MEHSLCEKLMGCRHILILSFHLRLSLQSDFFPSDLHTKFIHAFLFSSLRVTCPAHLNILDSITLIISCEKYIHEANNYVIPSSLLVFPPFSALTIHFIRYFRIQSFYFLSIMSQTEYRTRTSQQAKLWFCIF